VIYAEANGRRLAWLRIVVFAAWIVERLLQPLPGLAVFPFDYFQPHGPWLLFGLERLPSEGWLRALDAISCGLAGLALIGAPRPQLWAAGAALCFTLQEAFVRGFGHANHAQLALLFVSYALCFAPAWDELSIARPRQRAAPADYVTSFGNLTLALTFSYFSVGVTRVISAGPQLFLGDAMLAYIASATLMPAHTTFDFGRHVMHHAQWLPLINAGFIVTTAAEIAAPWVPLRRAYALAWLTLMLGFHVLSTLVMNIFFAHNMLLIALLIGWPCSWGWGDRKPVEARASALDEAKRGWRMGQL
jgi:hypothetical protein